MRIYNKAGSFFERPGLTTNIILTVNFAFFALCYYEGGQFVGTLFRRCALQDLTIAGGILTAACEYRIWIPYLLSILLLVATIIVHRTALMRGLKDVGFINAGLRADRNRCQGI